MPVNRPEQVQIWFGHLTEHLVSALFPVDPLVRIGIRQVQEHRAVTPVATVLSVRGDEVRFTLCTHSANGVNTLWSPS